MERDLIPDMRTDNIEHFIFLKMEQNQINPILLNGILENILHKPPTQSMNVSMQQILTVQGIEVQEKFKKYFESFDLARVFKSKMVNAGNLVLANYYETRFMNQVEEVAVGSPKAISQLSIREFKDYAKENGTQSLAIEGYKFIESDIHHRVEHQNT